MNDFVLVEKLLDYGIKNKLMTICDVEVVRNELWRFLQIECDLDDVAREPSDDDIYDLLGAFVANHKDRLELEYEIESFQAELMSKLLPRNSELNQKFWALHKESPEKATAYFYALSNRSAYIRMDRVKNNVSWTSNGAFGELDITINLSKPEKSPKEIAMMKEAKPSVYPKCLICVENAGYGGNIKHPARQNHRLVKMDLGGEDWYFQYSPYVYYNEHAIVLCKEHRNMKIDRNTFVRLSDFVDLLPHYFVGSNADLHTVGGSILTHDHYQAGNYEMPMMRAKEVARYNAADYPNVDISVLEWPLSVVKLSSRDRERLIDLADNILSSWIEYSDFDYDLISHTDQRHNTVTPIMRKKNGVYELYLALRNNRHTPEHPSGLFHPHDEHHHIKRENIGLIEVMGLAVLPGRLVAEKNQVMEMLVASGGYKSGMFDDTPELIKHDQWVASLGETIKDLISDEQALSKFFDDEIGKKFELALIDSGVYKEHYEGVLKFLEEGCLL